MPAQPPRAEEPRSAGDIRDWNRIAATYAGMVATPDDRIYPQFHAALWECLGDLHGRDVLDLGCGHGWLSHAMQQAGARVWGIDGSAELLRRARDAYPEIDFAEHDLTRGLPPTDRTFDRIVAYMVLMDLPEIGPLVAAVRRVLKPDGRFIFTIPHPCFFHYPARRDLATGRLARMVAGYLRPDVWRIENFGGHNHYHRSLTDYADHLRANRLAITRLYEPPHIPEPGNPDAEFWSSIPVFLLVEAAVL